MTPTELLATRVRLLIGAGDAMVRLPRWMRPAVVGAGIVGSLVLLRVIGAVLIRKPKARVRGRPPESRPAMR